MTWRSFLAGCWFGHDRIRERDAKGRYWLVCQVCQDKREVLKGQKFKARKEVRPVLRLARRKSA